jgi:hypothetical protein
MLQFTASLDDSRAGKQSLLAKLGIAHSFFVPIEVASFDLDVCYQTRIRG